MSANSLNEENCFGSAFMEGTKQFTIKPQTVPVVDKNITFFNSALCPSVPLTINGGAMTYDQFTTALLSNLVMVYEVEVRVFSGSSFQLNEPFYIETYDLSGDNKKTPVLPTVNPLQKYKVNGAGNVINSLGQVRFNFIDNFNCPYILDGISNLSYTVKAGVNWELLFRYKQIFMRDIMYQTIFKQEFEKLKQLNKNGVSNFNLNEAINKDVANG